ncbi:MAG TPA: hypothetical protein VFD92_08655 [Candidatus Binatia bacterium]|nr:hypothetical protein [Candidatus Binatia bacterium]
MELRVTKRWAIAGSIAGLLAAAAAAGAAPGDPLPPTQATARLPQPLRQRLTELVRRPHSFPPLTIFSEAPTRSLLFGYYLLDTSGFQPNVFTTVIPSINSGTIPTATGPNHGLPTIGSVRMVVEPKPGLPTDPNDAEAFIDVFTDISGLFVINNESGWYEGWMIHDLEVPEVLPPRADGHAMFGAMTADDAMAIAAMGGGHNVPTAVFTTDGEDVRLPDASDHFPDRQTNLVPLQLSMGAYNCLQQGDCHSYWEFNEYTDWVFPLYELPFTGGIPGTFEAGQIGARLSIVPGSGPSGVTNDPVVAGDDPDDPRDPDRGQTSSPDDSDRPAPPNAEHTEMRTRFVPSGLANEVLLDVYVRVASYEPAVTDLRQRIFDAYRDEIARVDENGDGIVSFEEADLEDESDGQPNERLYLTAPAFHRFAVTREIDDGLLAPRFAPSQRAWVLRGDLTIVSPPVLASRPQDADNR